VGSGGSFSTKVKGGASHVISIWDGFWMYQNNVYFESGVPKMINVEAV
jgi:beta-glucanase (GH16 family)